MDEHSRNRYDRQLQLWGDEGQVALTQAHVTVLGLTVSSVEALRNLVVAGVRHVSLVDERCVGDAELHAIFLLTMEDKGRYLAEAVMGHLQPLSEEFHGNAEIMTPSEWVDQYCHEAGTSSTSVCSDLGPLPQTNAVKEAIVIPRASPPATILVSDRYSLRADAVDHDRLAKTARHLRTPMVFLMVKGMMGYLQLCSNDRVVLNPEEEEAAIVADLRPLYPFPELQGWMEAHGPQNVLSETHQLPIPCLWYHAYKDWTQGRTSPLSEGWNSVEVVRSLSMSDLRGITQCVESILHRVCPEGRYDPTGMRCLPDRAAQKGLPQHLSDIFTDKRCAHPQLGSSSAGWMDEEVLLWCVLRSVHHFYVKHKVLPHNGYVPDMQTTTLWYCELKKIYEHKHKEDVQEIVELAKEVWLSSVDSSPEPNDVTLRIVTEQMEKLASTTCQHVWNLHLVRPRGPWGGSMTTDHPLGDIVAPSSRALAGALQRSLFTILSCEDDVTLCKSAPLDRLNRRLVNWCFSASMLLCHGGLATNNLYDECIVPVNDWCEDDRSSHSYTILGRLLTSKVGDEEASNDCDAPIAAEVLRHWWSANHAFVKDVCVDVESCATHELPCTAAAVGALAAQECVKLLQSRRVPISAPLFYNGYLQELFYVQ